MSTLTETPRLPLLFLFWSLVEPHLHQHYVSRVNLLLTFKPSRTPHDPRLLSFLTSIHHILLFIIMESWRGRNYLTSKPDKWIELMNLSTVEWGIGYLPAGLKAIAGRLNSSYQFPPHTTVIQNAGKEEAGSRDVEKIVFGVTSGVVIFWAIIWLYLNYSKFSSVGNTPLNPTSSDAASLGTSITMNNFDDENFVKTRDFRDKLRYFYYESDKTEVEIREKDFRHESVDAEDIETVNALLRQMFSLDLKLWAGQQTRRARQGGNAELMAKSDAILAEVHRLVASWNVNLNDPQTTVATDAEKQEMRKIVEFLQRIGTQRYANMYPQDSAGRRTRWNDQNT